MSEAQVATLSTIKERKFSVLLYSCLGCAAFQLQQVGGSVANSSYNEYTKFNPQIYQIYTLDFA